MSQVKFPALIGESPLAILAAIGTFRLIHDFVDDDARLSWDPNDRAPVLHSRLATVDAVGEERSEIVAEMPEDVVVPGAPPSFPRQKVGTKGSDPMRAEQGRLNGLAGSFSEDAAQISTVRDWIASLLTDLVHDDEGKCAISQFMAPSGQQTMFSMLRKPLCVVQTDPEHLYRALVGWRRVEGVTGEYLDHRAVWSAAEDPNGEAQKMRGVPGATWLALMSYPAWTTTATGSHPRTSGWHAVGRPPVQELRLPLWWEPLGPRAVKALVEHPVLEGKGEEKRLDADALRLLGIFHVCRARRRKAERSKSKSAGVLVPVS